MRTTVRLDPALMAKAKEESARTGETLTAMIERGLRLILAGPRRKQRKTLIHIPVSRATGGLRPGVNLDDSASVLYTMENRE
jgi:hypothetical protein